MVEFTSRLFKKKTPLDDLTVLRKLDVQFDTIRQFFGHLSFRKTVELVKLIIEV